MSTPPKRSRATPTPGPRSPAPRCKPTSSRLNNAASAWPHAQQLEKRLSEMLGEQAWRASGLGAPTDIEELQRKIVFLGQQVIDQRLELETREEELAAARSANRGLMTQLNGTQHAG
jgi:hypothetical protein